MDSVCGDNPDARCAGVCMPARMHVSLCTSHSPLLSSHLEVSVTRQSRRAEAVSVTHESRMARLHQGLSSAAGETSVTTQSPRHPDEHFIRCRGLFLSIKTLTLAIIHAKLLCTTVSRAWRVQKGEWTFVFLVDSL